MSLAWLRDIADYIREHSYGLAAIRVFEYNQATYGIIEPYGYYVINYKSAIYLMRSERMCIKFFVKNDVVATSIVETGSITIGYMDSLFKNPPLAATKLQKFILFHDKYPRHYTAIALINKCLDLRIFYID